MPHTLPAIDSAVSGYALPSDVARAAMMANPLGPELKCRAIVAALNYQLMPFRGVPEFFVEAVASGLGRGKSLIRAESGC
jgi:hypothetical protein